MPPLDLLVGSKSNRVPRVGYRDRCKYVQESRGD